MFFCRCLILSDNNLACHFYRILNPVSCTEFHFHSLFNNDSLFNRLECFTPQPDCLQGCLANSNDGKRQKSVRISQIVRISRTIDPSKNPLKNEFLFQKIKLLVIIIPYLASEHHLTLTQHLQTYLRRP